jgi:hypothetical protein
MSAAPLFHNSSLPPELDDRVRAELASGERLLWVGQPNPRRAARVGWLVTLFGIPFLGGAVFWIATASSMLDGFRNAPGPFRWFGLLFPLFGVPFMLVGLGMLSAPYWLARKARRTCYAITDRRAVVFEASWRGIVTIYSYDPDQLTKQYRRENADGGGDLVFEEITTVNRSSDGPSTTTVKRGFLAIDDVRAVETLLRQALPRSPG